LRTCTPPAPTRRWASSGKSSKSPANQRLSQSLEPMGIVANPTTAVAGVHRIYIELHSLHGLHLRRVWCNECNEIVRLAPQTPADYNTTSNLVAESLLAFRARIVTQ
jgi:hypothetical protein